MQANFDHCAALVREADRDRYLATLFAPAEHRDALFALYAFNAEIARVRDVAREPLPGEIRLQWWREVLTGERDGEAAAHPVAAALRETLGRYGFVVTPLLELIEARNFDLYDEPMATIGELELYGIRTQSPVFALASGILGKGGPPPELFTLDVGVAYTIGASLSRLGRHAARRQLYVPLEVLQRHQVDPEDIFAARVSQPLLAALAEMRGLARTHLAAAQAKLKSAPPEILPALLPVALVGPMLRRMERAGYAPFEFEPAMPWRRQWQLWRAARDPNRIFRA
ncbi:MAG TPA: phytoene/squalene synthase family protein [Pseudolabrys sp.]|nr:phytoene/squalene synthase family protein [Pseudolabrys sp.]